MILVWFMDLFYTVFDVLLGWINLPLIEDLNAITEYMDIMITNGAGLVKFFFGNTVFNVCLSMLVALNIVDTIYWIVMWILKKIPMAGMD